MTPDLKRLCAAAEAEVEQAVIDAGNNRKPDTEAIVRAVLMALREPSREAKSQASRSTENDIAAELVGYGWAVEDASSRHFTAIIDHILAEPATA